MSPLPPGLLPTRTLDQQRRLRLRRFGMASSTYLLGMVLLGVCTLLGLFPASALLAVGLLFLAVNAGLLLMFTTGWNERFVDPSLTTVQVCLGVAVVPVILVLGRDVHFVAPTYYSVIFVFGMLKLHPRDLVRIATFVLVTYVGALALRYRLYGGQLDGRVEIVCAMLVLAGNAWFAVASSYISHLRARLRASLQHIAALATNDSLTGLWNRRQIDQMLDDAVKQAERQGTPLCVAMLDLDHFKRINDRHGHAVGDEALKAVAGLLAGSVRAGDEVGRFGGEEFILLLPATTMAQATALVDRLRQGLETMQALPDDAPPVTASFGLAAWRAGESVGDLVRRADQALYRAKAGGRNRVEADGLFGALANR